MEYETFKKLFTDALNNLHKYSIKEVGSLVFAEKAGELEDKYPLFAEKFFAEAK